MNNNKNLFDYMDALRAIAAILVVWNHSWNMLIEHDEQKFNGVWKIINLSASFGHDSVILFFILSGFFIAKSVQSAVADNRFTWINYSIDRLSRLWIVLIPVLILVLIYDNIGIRVYSNLYELDRSIIFATGNSLANLNASNFFASLFFIQPFYFKPLGSNGPLWSLSYEFWYYVWFPILFLCIQKYRKPLLIIFSLALVVLTMFLFDEAARSFHIWLLGVVLYNLNENYDKFEKFISKYKIPILLINLFLFVSAFILSRSIFEKNVHLKDTLVAISFINLLIMIKISDISFVKIFEPLKKYGAGSSFSLYLTHIPLVFLIIAFVAPEKGLLVSTKSLLIALAISIIAIIQGYLFSLFTENNTSKIRKFLKNKLNKPI